MDAKMTEFDPVNRPQHYVEQSATVEPIEILRWAPFDLGNALKYMIRAGHKDNELQDLEKAAWYLSTAYESCWTHSKPYDNFFRRYGLILLSFPGMPKSLTIDYGDQAIEDLQKHLSKRIKECEQSQNH